MRTFRQLSFTPCFFHILAILLLTKYAFCVIRQHPNLAPEKQFTNEHLCETKFFQIFEVMVGFSCLKLRSSFPLVSRLKHRH